MMTKKITVFLLTALFLLALFPSCSGAAPRTVTVQIPTYNCFWYQRGDLPVRALQYQNSQYPLLNYKDITYFPMTWEYCNCMNLSSVWVEGEGLFIAYHPDYARAEQSLPVYQTVRNARWNTAVIPAYPVYLNGEPIPTDAAYPILNFRDVTYFPLTWEYAHDTFGWDLDFIVDGKDNQFSIQTFREGLNLDHMYVWEETETGAVIRHTMPVPTWTDSETVNYDYRTVYKRIDFSSGTVEVPDSYDPPSESENRTYDDRSEELSTDGLHLLLGGTVLDEISCLADGSETADSLHFMGTEWEEKGVTFTEVSVYAKWDEIPAPYTPHEDFLYLNRSGNYTLIQKDANVNRVEVYGNDVYVDATKRTGFRGTHFLTHQLYKITPEDTVTDLTATDPNHNSLKLIGKTDGGIVVEALWAPESEASDVGGDYFSNLSVSPYNDGFFLYDGNQFSLLHRYTFSTGALVSPEGDIYLMNGYRGSIRKLG